MFYDDEADDNAVLDFFVELLEIVLRAYGPRASCLSVRMNELSIPYYRLLHDMIQKCKLQGFPDDSRNNFSIWAALVRGGVSLACPPTMRLCCCR